MLFYISNSAVTLVSTAATSLLLLLIFFCFGLVWVFLSETEILVQ